MPKICWTKKKGNLTQIHNQLLLVLGVISLDRRNFVDGVIKLGDVGEPIQATNGSNIIAWITLIKDAPS